MELFTCRGGRINGRGGRRRPVRRRRLIAAATTAARGEPEREHGREAQRDQVFLCRHLQGSPRRVGKNTAHRGNRVRHGEGTGHIVLSKRTVDGLSVEDKDVIVWDRELQGFGVRVYPSGAKVYLVQSRGPRGSKRIALGRHGVILTDRARRRAALVIARIKAGEEPVPSSEALTNASPTVTELAERYLSEHVAVRCKPNTARGYRQVIDTHVLPVLGKLPISALGREHVADLHYRLRRTPTAANQAVETLSRMLNQAEAWGAGSAGEQSLPLRGQVQDAQAGAVPDGGRVPPPRRNAGRAGGRGTRPGARGGGAAAVDADRVPVQRDHDPSVGKTCVWRQTRSVSPTARRGRAWCRCRRERHGFWRACRAPRAIPGSSRAAGRVCASPTLPTTGIGCGSRPGSTMFVSTISVTASPVPGPGARREPVDDRPSCWGTPRSRRRLATPISPVTR